MISFVPAGKGYYGAAYISFFAIQGGMNTEGLAFEWTTTATQETWDPDLPEASGNPSQRMLESCVTVDDAIAFYHAYNEPTFVHAKILVADRSGASAVVGAKDGKLRVEKVSHLTFGVWSQPLEKMLAANPEPAEANGYRILHALTKPGLTRFSNIFDLKSGSVCLLPFLFNVGEVRFDLRAELKKGGHCYDIHRIGDEPSKPPNKLNPWVDPTQVDRLAPIPDQEPEVTSRVRQILLDLEVDTPKPGDYTAEMWNVTMPELKRGGHIYNWFGQLRSLTLVERSEKDGLRSYTYRIELRRATMLDSFVFGPDDKLALIRAGRMEDKTSVTAH
jgi:hypothetical protein